MNSEGKHRTWPEKSLRLIFAGVVSYSFCYWLMASAARVLSTMGSDPTEAYVLALLFGHVILVFLFVFLTVAKRPLVTHLVLSLVALLLAVASRGELHV